MAAAHIPFGALAGPHDVKSVGVRRGAHFVLAQFPAPYSRHAFEWIEATKEIAVSIGAEPPVAGSRGMLVGWRLVTENNRELARSYLLRADEADTKRDAQRLRAHAHGLDLQVVVTANLRGAGWCGLLDGVPVVVGARRYENRSAARGAAELARRLLIPAAPDQIAPVVVTP